MKYFPLFIFLTLTFYSCGNNTKNINNLRINQVQVIGSHNSYKQAIAPSLFKLIVKRDSVHAMQLQYSHISLSAQLNLGLRNLEIDIYSDPNGGAFAHPKGLVEAPNQKPYDTSGVMMKPGFKVLHIPNIDFRSSCLTFKKCLLELKNWSDAHPHHYPVFITMNTKNHFNSAAFDRLDQYLLKYLGRKRLIIPNDVRGNYPTLEYAVLYHNWPKVKKARGKFIFILDEKGQKRAEYMAGHPSLKGRILFVNAKPGTPDAAILIRNFPKKELHQIQQWVKEGYIVRTRADANTIEARNDNYSRFKAARKSGAQIITTDYYYPSKFFKSDYKVSFSNSNNKYMRVDPLFKNKN